MVPPSLRAPRSLQSPYSSTPASSGLRCCPCLALAARHRTGWWERAERCLSRHQISQAGSRVVGRQPHGPPHSHAMQPGRLACCPPAPSTELSFHLRWCLHSHPPLSSAPPGPDLADAATASASKHHGAAPVVVGSHGSQAVVLVHKQRCALDGDRAPQRLVEVLSAEVIVNLQRLWGGGGKSQVRGEAWGPKGVPARPACSHQATQPHTQPTSQAQANRLSRAALAKQAHPGETHTPHLGKTPAPSFPWGWPHCTWDPEGRHSGQAGRESQRGTEGHSRCCGKVATKGA